MECQDSPEAVRAISPGSVIGYMDVNVLAPGLGRVTEQVWCQAHRGPPVANGIPTGGPHRFAIRNTTHDDVLVKLKNVADDRSVIALYVAANAIAQAAGIPDGIYRVVLATDADFSRACQTFTRDLQTVAYPQTRTLIAQRENWYRIGTSIALTLRSSGGTYTPAEVIPPERFWD
ncbi:MAG: hypothetical protein FD153_1174 [Rhodospirillaceae bacterium]|nr:MAG: hypothetical protein FD153_1174 [Rhodospirillaceae bacterium]